MASRILIVNNGLRDLRGHYFETSVSTAHAADKLGLKPILVGHISCPPKLIPSWLEFLPLCRTDHWMVNPVPPAADLNGVRCDILASSTTSIEDVCRGTVSLTDYLLARFEPLTITEPITPPEVDNTSSQAPEPATIEANIATKPLPPRLRSRIKKNVKSITPPLIWNICRALFRRRRWVYATVKAILPPFVYLPLRKMVRRALGKTDSISNNHPETTSDKPSTTLAHPPIENTQTPEVVVEQTTNAVIDPVKVYLEHHGFPQEYHNIQLYYRDMEILLTLLQSSSEDHVFFPTSHGRELLAIRQIVSVLNPERCPTFHLEFRHALDYHDEDFQPANQYTELHVLTFDIYRSLGHDSRIRLYTDTAELTEVYCNFSGLEFETLPIPFRTDLIVDRHHNPDDPITITMLGDARDEKGFHLLPDLVEALQPLLAAEKIRFSIQASLIEPHYNPLSVPALERLKALAGSNVVLHGLDGPLHPDLYFKLLSQTDLMLCPYDALSYHRRSSGVLTEAIAAGIPTIVTAGTWLHRQQPDGTGETFTDVKSFIEAVEKVILHYPDYLQKAKLVRSEWLEVHTPENLVHTLIGKTDTISSRQLQEVA